MQKKLAYVVPCYNEEKRLRFQDFGPLLQKDIAICMVNDGSTDGTKRLLEDFSSRHPGIQIIHLPQNSGKAEAVRQGLLQITAGAYSHVGYFDADMATPATELISLWESAQNCTSQVILGSRVEMLGTSINRKPHRHYLGRFFATLASLSLGIKVYDTQCGAKIFANTHNLHTLLSRPFHSRWAFDIELLARLLYPPEKTCPPLTRDDMIEVPLREWRDVSGTKLYPLAMVRTGSELWQIFRDIVKARKEKI